MSASPIREDALREKWATCARDARRAAAECDAQHGRATLIREAEYYENLASCDRLCRGPAHATAFASVLWQRQVAPFGDVSLPAWEDAVSLGLRLRLKAARAVRS